MTELIVALDGPRPYLLARQLAAEAGVRLVKIGPQALLDQNWQDILKIADLSLFLDLKLADTADTCREAAKRFADAGVAAISTFTDRATEAAIRGAEGSPLRVWRILRLTDGNDPVPRQLRIGDGIICSVGDLHAEVTMSSDIDKVCPGIRLAECADNHRQPATPQDAIAAGATHIVVGRPIWQAAEPVAAALWFKNTLAQPCAAGGKPG